MNLKGLAVPNRPAKPRTTGMTWCIDDGMPLGAFTDTLDSFHHYIDGVKFGWGTALVTDNVMAKMALCRSHHIDYAFGGTLFEAYYVQGRLNAFWDLVLESQCPVVEISDGTITLPAQERRQIIHDFTTQVRVFSEVGQKDPEASSQWNARDWINGIMADLEAGAERIILETRESGTSGLCETNGEIRSDLANGILGAGIDTTRLLFEAPQKQHQTYWIYQLGPSVNLANIPLPSTLNLETLRLGLRSDTFFLVDQPMPLLWS